MFPVSYLKKYRQCRYFYSIQQLTAFFTQLFNFDTLPESFSALTSVALAGADFFVALASFLSPVNNPMFNPQNIEYNPYDWSNKS